MTIAKNAKEPEEYRSERGLLNHVENILASVDLLSIVPPDAELKSVGPDKWRGRCPIGNHAAGAFSVKRHRDGHLIFTCFSCHKRGSVIDLFAEINGITIREAIGKLLDRELPELSPSAMLQRSHDNWMRNQPQFAWLVCDDCGAMEKLDSELDFVILCGFGSWLWDVCGDGSARCVRCRRFN